jgi:alginate O-acetyltransferase complex protein AlgJ
LPVAFFGYAAFANYTLLFSDIEGPKLAGLLTGRYTQGIDSLYRSNLPHREPAIGLVGAARYVLLNEGRDGVVAGRDGWLFSAEEFRTVQTAGPVFDATLEWILASKSKLEANGSQLVLMPIPAKLEIASHPTDATGPVHDISLAYDEFLVALTENGISTVDPRRALLAQKHAFFPTDTHWTAEGAIAASLAVAESGLIELGETDFITQTQGDVTFVGDLVSFVTSDALAPHVGLKPEIVTPYIANLIEEERAEGDVLDLFGTDGPAPLALVGTSYSANPNWSFSDALKLALGQDVLNYALEGQGPVAPMAAFLKQIDPMAPPPTVIWEFPIRYLSDPALFDAVTPDANGGDDNA